MGKIISLARQSPSIKATLAVIATMGAMWVFKFIGWATWITDRQFDSPGSIITMAVILLYSTKREKNRLVAPICFFAAVSLKYLWRRQIDDIYVAIAMISSFYLVAFLEASSKKSRDEDVEVLR